MESKKYPYWGVCDVKGCHFENCNGGICWRETGYWNVCSIHADLWRKGKPQPEMKVAAIKKEKSRNKITGWLPIKRLKQ